MRGVAAPLAEAGAVSGLLRAVWPTTEGFGAACECGAQMLVKSNTEGRVMTERLMIRTEGGPNSGTRIAEDWVWPLPELLLAEGGAYIKASEGDWRPTDGDSRVLRGASYGWQSGTPSAEQLLEAIATELKTRRFRECVALHSLLALVDPGQAQDLWDMIKAAADA